MLPAPTEPLLPTSSGHSGPDAHLTFPSPGVHPGPGVHLAPTASGHPGFGTRVNPSPVRRSHPEPSLLAMDSDSSERNSHDLPPRRRGRGRPHPGSSYRVATIPLRRPLGTFLPSRCRAIRLASGDAFLH